MTARDYQRGKVYSAETMFGRMLARAAERCAPSVELAGTTVNIPPLVRFGSIEGTQDFVDRILHRPSVVAAFGPVRPVAVRARGGTTATAHYEIVNQVIAVPDDLDKGMLRCEVLLHELAHHFVPHDDVGGPHGPAFTATMLWLLDDVVGAEAEFILRVLYYENGVQVGAPVFV